MSEDAFAARVTRVGALADPVRRRLYRFISGQPDAVSREQAADAVDVPRHTAKFHLERLVDAGLLVTEFRRLTGRTGPGAGRPAKLYRRARREIAVSLPIRRYDLAGDVLADAVERALAGVPMAEALEDAAGAAARTVAAETTTETSTPDEPGDGLREALARLGYEPRTEAGEAGTVLGNCPYARLAEQHAHLVCAVNERFVAALGDQLGSTARVTRHQSGPHAGSCCVRLSGQPQPSQRPE